MKKDMEHRLKKTCLRNQAGNAIVFLFAAIAMAGTVTYGLNNVMRGPGVTASEVTRKTIAENNLVATTRMTIMASAQQAGGGDCDGDGFVEPLPYRDAGVLPKPTGGGLIPMTMGASVSDPWGTQYGYCIWDPGTASVSNAVPACGGATPRRLQGAPRDDQYAIAVISAGKNGAFETSCIAYADTAPADGLPDATMLNKPAGSDDIVLAYSYAEANGIGGGIWKLKPGDDTTATVNKNIETLGGATFNAGPLTLQNKGLVLPGDPGDNTVTGPCDSAKEQQLRRNVGDGTTTPAIEICNSGTWEPIAGGGAATALEIPDTALQKLVASVAIAGEQFGVSSAIDEDTAIIGAYNPASTGAVYVFTKSGGVWSQTQKLTASDQASGDYFGAKVSIENDTIIVGAYHDDDAGTSSGSAYVFTKSGTWSQTQKLTASDAAGDDRFGYDVDISGNVIMVGAINNDDAGSNSGSAYVFTKSGTWSQTQKITASDASSSDNFGFTVRIDGSTALIGASGDNTNTGSAYVFTKSGSTWSQAQKLTASDGANGDLFGAGLDVSGSTAIIGSYGDDSSKGSIYVFKQSGPTWSQTQKLTASDGETGEFFGRYISLSASIAVIGVIGDDTAGAQTGSAYIYTDTSGAWSEVAKLDASDAAAGDSFGISVAIDGNDVLIGSFQDDDGGTNTGSAYVFGPGISNGQRIAAENVTGTQTHPLDVGLVAHWKMDDGAGTSVIDSVGGYNGTFKNTPVWISGVNGSSALSFNKIEEDGVTAPAITLSSTEATVAAWVNVGTPDSSGSDIISKGGDLVMRILPSGQAAFYVRYGASTWRSATSSDPVEPGWNHIVGTVNEADDTLRIYVNGVMTGSYAFTDTITWASTGTAIGHNLSNNTYDHNGGIDDVRIYSRSLGPSEVVALSYRARNSSKERSKAYLKPSLDFAKGKISIGGGHTCGIKADGSAWCAGLASTGALGNGMLTPNQSSPSLIANPGPWLSLDSGNNHTCAIKTDGSAWCWGVNAQLGAGTLAGSFTPYPVAVNSAGPWASISAGTATSCGIKTNGSAWCWGQSALGALGNGTTTPDQTSPVAVNDVGPWASISAGGITTCGVKTNGSAWCWGYATEGGLGNGTTSPNQSSPVAVLDPGPWSYISTANQHSCGIKTDGSIWCWGRGTSGQLGNGIASSQTVPVPISETGPWISVSTGQGYSCAIKADGSAWCWGLASNYILGNGNNITNQLRPTRVLGGGYWTEISTSTTNVHTCGMKSDGSAWCWGSDGGLSLANGPSITADQPAPYPVSYLSNAAPFTWNDAFTTILLNGNMTLGMNTAGNGWMVTTAGQYFGFSDAGKMVVRQNTGNNQLLIESTAAAQPAQISFRAGNESAASSDYTTGLAAEWLFDDTSGTTATASIGGLNGTITGAAVWNTSGGRKGDNVAVTNGTLEFDSTLNSRVSIANNAILQPAEVTVSAWIRTNGPQDTNASVISKAHSANSAQPYESYGLRFVGPTEIVFSKGSAVRSETTPGPVKPGAWTHVVGSFGAGTPRNRLYINGVLVGTSNDANAIVYDGAASGNLFIGAAGCASMPCQQYNGAIDDLRIYNTQLTDAQVYQLYKNQSAAAQVPHTIGIDQAANTLEIARNNAGMTNLLSSVTPDFSLNATGSLAIGGATAQSRVDVSSGGVKIGYQPTCGATAAGTVRYDAGYGYYCTGDLSTWSARASASAWYDLASSASGEKLAAVVSLGQIYTSVNGGKTWVARESNRNWTAIASSADGARLAAAGAGTNIYISIDSGKTWSPKATSLNWRGLAMSADGMKIVGVVYGGQIYTSTDGGETWTVRESARNWFKVTSSADGTKLAAVVYLGQIYTSTDSGATWMPRESSRGWYGINSSYDGTRLVAVVAPGQIYTSTDSGVTWTPRDSAREWFDVASSADGMRLVAVERLGKIYQSADGGVTWAARESAREWREVASSADGYKVVASVFGGQIYTTKGCAHAKASCGETWTQGAAPTTNTWRSVIYANGQFVAVSEDGASQVMTSPNGATWTPRSAAAVSNWLDLAYGAGTYVAIAGTGATRAMTSPDGITWTSRTAAQANTWGGIAFGNGIFVAVSRDGANRVMTSPDGITWTARTAAEANNWRDVAFGNGLFVAVSGDGTNRVMTSPDGITWTARTAAENNFWRRIAFGGGLFVAVASDGTNRVMTSPDGITWTARTAAEDNFWSGVTYAGNMFVAVSEDGISRIMTSPDGITWTARTAPESNSWNSVAYGNSTVVAVSSSGTNRAMYSACSQFDPANPWKLCNGTDWVDVPPTPAEFNGVLENSSFAASWYHSCAVNNAGNLYCFGDQANGKLGNGVNPTSTDGSIIPGLVTPVKVGTDKWKMVGVTFNHSCGIKADGTLWCWGAQVNGRLGNGLTTGAQTTPLQIGTATWQEIAAKHNHTCGIQANGTLWCWGQDSGEALGNGATSTDQTTPLQIGTATWQKIAVNSTHTCGIQTNGTLWCWGDQANGKLGNGLTAGSQTTPLQIGTDTWIYVSAGSQHTCGIKSAGTLWCWGNQVGGRLGNGVTTGNQATPVQIAIGTFWKNIATGYAHTCGIQTSGTLWCWGDDTFGPLGNGGAGSQSTPVQIGSDLWGQVDAANYYSLGMKADRSVWGWGSGGFGQLGIGVSALVEDPTKTISGN